MLYNISEYCGFIEQVRCGEEIKNYEGAIVNLDIYLRATKQMSSTKTIAVFFVKLKLKPFPKVFNSYKEFEDFNDSIGLKTD